MSDAQPQYDPVKARKSRRDTYEMAVNDCYEYLVFYADLETEIAKRIGQQMRDKLRHEMRARP